MYKYEDYATVRRDDFFKIVKNRELSDEERLEKMDIRTIENFLRKKKLKNITK